MTDDIPVFGPELVDEGIFTSSASRLHGFQLGPGAGAVMTELIAGAAAPRPGSAISASTAFILPRP